MVIRHHDSIADRLETLGLTRRAASRLSHSGTLLDLGAGTTLCHEGERGTQAFLLIDGQAEVLTPAETVAVGPGAVVGELATLDPHRTRNATVVATTPLRVLVFDVRTYRSLAERDDLRARLAPERSAA